MRIAIAILFVVGLLLTVFGAHVAKAAHQDDFSFIIPLGAGLLALAVSALLVAAYALWRLFT